MYKISNFDLIKNQLKELESQVNDLELSNDIPQLIDKANLIRENEILKTNDGIRRIFVGDIITT